MTICLVQKRKHLSFKEKNLPGPLKRWLKRGYSPSLRDAVLDADADPGQRLDHALHCRLVGEREHDGRWNRQSTIQVQITHRQKIM